MYMNKGIHVVFHQDQSFNIVILRLSTAVSILFFNICLLFNILAMVHQFESHCYERHTSTFNYWNAKQTCEEVDAYLVSIGTQQENVR